MSIELDPFQRRIFRWIILFFPVLFVAAACAATNAGIPTPADLDGPALPRVGGHVRDDSSMRSIPAGLATDFAALQAQLPGSIGMALMPVGGDRAVTFGNWTTGIAWSTIKVPLALAALRHDPVDLSDTASAAIRSSDNEAAQQLWDALGGGEQAADAVEEVLHEAGDTTTDVADRHDPVAKQTVDEPLSFGATPWTLVNQVRFASRLPCLQHASGVIDLMGEITSSQSWGLGAFNGAEFKGGWGPDDDTGAYLVRQFGLIPTWSGRLAVAFAAQPDSGTFEDATAMLDKMAAVLAKHAHELGGGNCPR